MTIFKPATAIAAALLATGSATAASDPLGDFLATYTGPANANLDLVSADARFTGTHFNLSLKAAGAIGGPAGQLYVIGINRGAGIPRLNLLSDPDLDTSVKWDSLAVMLPDGTLRVVTFPAAGAPTITPIFGGALVSGDTISAAVPFALNARGMNAWQYHGGGIDLFNEFLGKQGLVGYPGGNTGVQMGGWFRKEIKTVADVQGLKMRIAGLAGLVMQKLGAVPQQIPGGDIYPALERGTIDAAEWVGPYDDEKLGFVRVAPYYYAPGWWEAGPQLSFYVNAAQWAKLPKDYQAALEAASYECHVSMQASYDARNPAALARLLKNGAKLAYFSRPILEEAYRISTQVMEEEAARNPRFGRIYQPWKRFRNDQNMWASVAEASMQNFLISAVRK